MTNRGTVLVVDDEAVVRTSLENLLRAEAYAVLEAAKAPEALHIMEDQRVDLVITDLKMPGIDGLTLLKKIKWRSPRTPVVMLTGQGSMEIVIQALRQGVADFMNKPFEPDELLNIVGREIQRSRRWTRQQKAPMALGLYLSDADLDSIETTLATLRAELGAHCVMLVEGTGHAIAVKGGLDNLDISALTALVAGDMAAASSIAALIGEEDTFQMNYHEGEQHSVYSAQVVPEVFLLIVFGEQVKLGAVLYYARESLPHLKEILEDAQRMETRQAKAREKSNRNLQPPASSPPARQTSEANSGEGASPRPQGEAAAANVFSLEEIMGQGLLEDNALDSLEQQLNEMWVD